MALNTGGEGRGGEGERGRGGGGEAQGGKGAKPTDEKEEEKEEKEEERAMALIKDRILILNEVESLVLHSGSVSQHELLQHFDL